MLQWYRVRYINDDGIPATMLCKGNYRGEALREAGERLGANEEIVSCMAVEPVFPSTYHNQTIDGLPRRARR